MRAFPLGPVRAAPHAPAPPASVRAMLGPIFQVPRGSAPAAGPACAACPHHAPAPPAGEDPNHHGRILLGAHGQNLHAGILPLRIFLHNGPARALVSTALQSHFRRVRPLRCPRGGRGGRCGRAAPPGAPAADARPCMLEGKSGRVVRAACVFRDFPSDFTPWTRDPQSRIEGVAFVSNSFLLCTLVSPGSPSVLALPPPLLSLPPLLPLPLPLLFLPLSLSPSLWRWRLGTANRFSRSTTTGAILSVVLLCAFWKQFKFVACKKPGLMRGMMFLFRLTWVKDGRFFHRI